MRKSCLVVIQRSDLSWRYGIVMGLVPAGQENAGNFRVQVTRDSGLSKTIPAGLIGKILEDESNKTFDENELKRLGVYEQIDRIEITSGDPQSKKKLDQYSFDANNIFKRGEVVLIQRSDLSYRNGIVMGLIPAGQEFAGQYRVQVQRDPLTLNPATGTYQPGSKPIAAQFIGKAKEIVSENLKPFPVDELKNMVVYTPVGFSFDWGWSFHKNDDQYYIQPYNLDKRYIAANEEYDQKKLAELGYSFDANNTFFHGEIVIAPHAIKNEEQRRRYRQYIVVAKNNNNTYKLIAPHAKQKNEFESIDLLPEKIGKNELFKGLRLKPLKVGKQQGFTYEQAKLIPNVSTAFTLLARQPWMMDLDDRKNYFKFDKKNDFVRGELVIYAEQGSYGSAVSSSFYDNPFVYAYAIVLGQIKPQVYKLQVEIHGNTIDLTTEHIGKIKLDFELIESIGLDIALGQKVLSEEDILPLDVVKLMAKKSPKEIREIKDAITATADHPYSETALKKALGEKHQYLEVADELGYTPLLYAIYVGNHEAVKYLLTQGANMGAQVKTGKMKMDAMQLAKFRQENDTKYNSEIIKDLQSTSLEDRKGNKIKKLKELEELIARQGKMFAADFNKQLQTLLKDIKPLLTAQERYELADLEKQLANPDEISSIMLLSLIQKFMQNK